MKKVIFIILLFSQSISQAQSISNTISTISSAQVINSPELDSLLGEQTNDLMSIYLATSSQDSLRKYIDQLDMTMFTGLDIYLGVSSGDIIESIEEDTTAFFIKPSTQQIIISVVERDSWIMVMVYSL